MKSGLECDTSLKFSKRPLKVQHSLVLNQAMLWETPASRRWCNFQAWTLQATGLTNDSQDVVFLGQMWHHIPPEEYPACTQELYRILRPGGIVILLDTFVPEDEGGGSMREMLFSIANRFYAVLSQHPLQSLRWRILHALNTFINPSQYNPAKYWYHSPTISRLQQCFLQGEFRHDEKCNHHYGISKMFVFEKNYPVT